MTAITLYMNNGVLTAGVVLDTGTITVRNLNLIYQEILAKVPARARDDYAWEPLEGGESRFSFVVNPHAIEDMQKKMLSMWSVLVKICPDLVIDSTMPHNEEIVH